MSIWSSPPTATKSVFRRGDVHLGVYSIQTALNRIGGTPLVEDGSFGVATEARVKNYQIAVGFTGKDVDGVVGQATQAKLAHSCIIRTPSGSALPHGLLEGLIKLESGNYIAAVNARVAGGVDYGFTQRRVYGPPFDPVAVQAAAKPVTQVNLAAAELDDNHDRYMVGMNPACPFNAWELAVLHHNWPWAADTYHRYGHLPDPTKIATWVTWATMTWDQWAHYYVKSVTAGVKW